MKTQIKKIFLITAALAFFSAGVSFANDRTPRSADYNSRWNVQGQFHKKPGYRPPNYKTHYYVYKNPGYLKRQYYRGHFYPKNNYRHHNYYRHYRRYPSRNTFFFGFSMR